jgi:hypothetical protein
VVRTGIAVACGAAYVMGMMADAKPITKAGMSSQPSIHRALLAVAGIGGILIAGTLGLWAHYGSAVFYEMILAGIAACF